MNIAHKVKHTFLLLIAFIIILSAPSITPAVQFSYNGVPTTLKDVNTPLDDYIGGSLSVVNPVLNGGTSLTFTTTQLMPRNLARNIVGGNLNLQANASTINGDIRLTVNNTNLSSLIGGTFSAGTDFTINGSIYIDITNVTATGVGCAGASFNGGGYVSGSINLNAENLTTNNLHGIARIGRGLGPNGEVLGGDINITLKNSHLFQNINVGSDYNVPIFGNINLTLINTTVDQNVRLVFDSDAYGEVTANILEGSYIRRELSPVGDGTLYNKSTINIKDSEVTFLYLGSDNDGSVRSTSIANISGNSRVHYTSLGANGLGFTEHAVVNFYDGSETFLLNMGTINGTTNLAEANIYGGEVINIYLGTPAHGQGRTNTAILNIAGGTITKIEPEVAKSIINFIPGVKSCLVKGISGNTLVNEINIHKNAQTQWGEENNNCSVEAGNFSFSGELFIPANSMAQVIVRETLTLNGGSIIPLDLMPDNTNIRLALGGFANTVVTINKPLNVILSYSPHLLGATNIPVVFVDPDISVEDIFEKQNRTGIIWSDMFLQKKESVWFLTNIRPSEDYYGLSAAREGSNWLRQQHIFSVQKRAAKTLNNGSNGLWIDVQGGREKLDAAIGNATMPWIMASLGYDFLQNFSISSAKFKALYGINLGFSKGKNKWSSVNTTKNDILTGMLSAYVGLMHDSGVYGTIAGQYAISKIKTKSSGFTANYKWTESIPTESVEIGWKCDLGEGFSINPKGQVIFEQLAKHEFKLKYDNDKAILKKSSLITTIVGLNAEYNFLIGVVPMGIEAGVDWIKCVSGDFAAKSKTMNITFKDKNDSSVVRMSLGLSTQITEQTTLSLNGFADVGNDKGAGGQLSASYKF